MIILGGGRVKVTKWVFNDDGFLLAAFWFIADQLSHVVMKPRCQHFC